MLTGDAAERLSPHSSGSGLRKKPGAHRTGVDETRAVGKHFGLDKYDKSVDALKAALSFPLKSHTAVTPNGIPNFTTKGGGVI